VGAATEAVIIKRRGRNGLRPAGVQDGCLGTPGCAELGKQAVFLSAHGRGSKIDRSEKKEKNGREPKDARPRSCETVTSPVHHTFSSLLYDMSCFGVCKPTSLTPKFRSMNPRRRTTIAILAMVTSFALVARCRREDHADQKSPVESAASSEATPPYAVQFVFDPVAIKARAPSSFHLRVVRPADGADADLDEVQGALLHIVAVRKDLGWYEHLHPDRTSAGDFAGRVTFPSGGEYVLFTSFRPTGDQEQTLEHHIIVEGAKKPGKPLEPSARRKQIGAYTVELLSDPSPPISHEWTTLTFRLSRGNRPVTNLRSAGALGHIVILREGAEDFIYSHSTDGEAKGGVRGLEHLPAAPPEISPHEHRGDDQGPEVAFHTTFDRPGLFKLWAEFYPGSDHITVDFVVSVEGGNVPRESH
jgi:hypothetical protein